MNDDSREEDRGRAAAIAAGAPRAAASKSGFALFQGFMTSTPVVASTLTAAMVISAIGWSDISRREKESDAALAKSTVEAKVRTGRGSYNPKLIEGLPGASASGPNALEMFRLRNRAPAIPDAADAPSAGPEAGAYEETPEERAERAGKASASPGRTDVLKAVEPFAGPADKDDSADEGGKKTAKKSAKALDRPSLGGAGGLSGGFNRGFDVPLQKPRAAPSPAPQDRLRAARTTGGRRADGRAMSGSRSTRKGGVQGAAKQLRSMNKAMKAAGTAGSATTAATHNSQWDGAGSVGQGLSGSGASGNAIEGGGQVYDDGGLGEGGPLNAAGANASAPSEGAEAPSVGKGRNATPNQDMIDAAMILLPIASLLLLGAFLTGQNPATKGAAKMLAYGALAVSGVVAGIGAMILTKGQAMQGGLLAAVGGALAVISYTAAEGNAAAAKGDEVAKDTAVQWAGPDGPTGPPVA